ncbi:MAG: hypothetical protein ACFFD2_07040 [Promethearchaeota archaeon]
MKVVEKEELKMLKKMMETEFTHDPALQQVHIARKIIIKEAAQEGLSFLEFIKK